MNNQALNKIGYGLYILTARCGGQDNGCIVNTFIQLASSPLRFGVSVSKENLSCGMLQKSAEFNITVLDESAQFETFKRFGFQSGKSVNKFADFDAFERQIEYQISNGIDAICILGTTGEAPTITDKEYEEIQAELIEKRRKQNKGRTN